MIIHTIMMDVSADPFRAKGPLWSAQKSMSFEHRTIEAAAIAVLQVYQILDLTQL